MTLFGRIVLILFIAFVLAEIYIILDWVKNKKLVAELDYKLEVCKSLQEPKRKK